MISDEQRAANMAYAKTALEHLAGGYTPFSWSGLDLRVQSSCHWYDNCDNYEATVANLLGIDVSRIESDWGGCDTCGFGDAILIVDWAKEDLDARKAPPEGA